MIKRSEPFNAKYLFDKVTNVNVGPWMLPKSKSTRRGSVIGSAKSTAGKAQGCVQVGAQNQEAGPQQG